MRVQFALYLQHTDKGSTVWRRQPPTKRGARHKKMVLKEQQVKIGVLEGSIPSASWDTACKYPAGMVGDQFIQKNRVPPRVLRC